MKFNNPSHLYAYNLELKLSSLKLALYRYSCAQIDEDLCKRVNSTLTVVFDDDHKPFKTGNASELIFLVNKLKSRYDSDNSKESEIIKTVLKRIENDGDFDYDISGEGLYYPLFNEKDWPNNPNIVSDLTRLKNQILKTHKEGKVNGYYDHKNRKIVLFTKNLDTYEDYLSTFAHEYFHAVHYRYLYEKDSKEKLSRYYHEVVLESLATAFQVYFLHSEYQTNKANKVQDSVSYYSPIFYPYSGANYIFKYHRDFCKILELSTTNFEDALRELVDRYEAEIILQMEYKDDLVDLDNNNLPLVRSKEGDLIMKSDNDKEITPYNEAPNKPIISGIFIDNPVTSGITRGQLLVNYSVYKVKQSKNFFKETMNEYLYGGKRYRMMGVIKKGDIIFHEYDNKIVGYSIARDDGYFSSSGEHGEMEGWYVNVQYFPLKNAWDIDYHPQQTYIMNVDINLYEHIINNLLNLNEKDAVLYLINKTIR